MKLRTRFLLILAAVILAGSVSTFVLIRASAESVFRSYVFSGDRDKAKLYAALLGELYAKNRSWEEAKKFLEEFPVLVYSFLVKDWAYPFTLPPGTSKILGAERIVVADEKGVIVADTGGNLLGTVHPPHHLETGVPVMADFRRVGTVLVGSMIDSSLTPTGERFLTALTGSLAAATLVSGLIAFVLGLFFMLRVSRALGKLTEGARRVAGGDLAVLIPVQGKDEIAELSDSFNHMTGELRKLEEAKRRIIADSAHELRTPVTLIQGLLEGMMDGIFPTDAATLKSVHEETLRLSRLIDTLRELEVIESGRLELHLEDVDLGLLASQAAALFAGRLQDKGLSLSLPPAEPAVPPIKVDRLRLGEVVYNLLANAVRHTPEGGRIRISIDRSEEFTVFKVEDSGPGVPEEEREKIFERFYRIDKARSAARGGSGLGLSIAREIVRAHGGSLTAEASDLGGAAFLVRLPACEIFLRK